MRWSLTCYGSSTTASKSSNLLVFASDTKPVIAVMNKAMCPVEHCVDLRKEEQRWFNDLNHDPTYCHTLVYTARTYFDAIRGQDSEPTLIMHMNNAIVVVQNKLADANLVVADSTIFTVLALAMISEVLGDAEAATKHLHGLYELIKLRGGVASLAKKHTLQIKCCRYVLDRKRIAFRSHVLATGLTSNMASRPVPSHCSSPTTGSHGSRTSQIRAELPRRRPYMPCATAPTFALSTCGLISAS